MVRNSQRKSDRGNYGETALADALKAIHEGCSIKKASRDFGICRRTLIETTSR